MKKPLFLLIAMTLLGRLPASAQPGPKDSLYFVRLTNGSIVYSRKVDLMDSRSRGKYLLLDSNRIIPLARARSFKGWSGAYTVGSPDGQFDAYKVDHEGRRISLYSQCYYRTETVYASTTPDGPGFPTTISTHEKAVYFSKDDSAIQRLTYKNLKLAVADNSASMQELRIAGTDLYVGIGLVAAGLGLLTAGIIQTHQRNKDAQNAFNAASRAWASQNNPNAPPPTLAHAGTSPLFWIGMGITFSATIPLGTVRWHTHKAIRIYNGIE